MSQMFQLPKPLAIDSNLLLMAGAKAFFYQTGTTTPQNTYQDADLTTPHTNPVVADSAGKFPPIWFNSALPRYKLVLKTSADVTVYTVDPVNQFLLSQAELGAIFYPRTAAEIAAGVTPTDYAYPEFNFLRYGADNTGVSSCTAALTSLNSVITAHGKGCSVEIPPGTYLFSSQATLTTLDEHRVSVSCYGAVFKSSGAISTLRISGATTTGGFSFYGLKADNSGDASCIAAFEIVGASRIRFYECFVRVGDNSATYAPWLWRNSTAADPDTGSFWGLLHECATRRLTGVGTARPAFAVIVRGAANAHKIIGGELGDADTVVKYEPESGQTYIANGCLIEGANLEGFATGVLSAAAVGVAQSGLRIVNNRVEPANGGACTFYSMTGATSQPASPTILGGNYFTSDLTTYINNPNDLYYFSTDNSYSPYIGPHLDSGRAIVLKNRSGDQGILDLQTGLNDAGIIFRDEDGTVVMTTKAQGSGIAEIIGGASDSLRILGLVQANFDTNSTTGQRVIRGSGTPEGAVSAPVGSIFLRSDGSTSTTLYVKTSGTGNTGWTAK